MSDMATPKPGRTPVVYFIDDSATMREVIKIAFRKENIHVFTCPDAASALAQFAETPPDAVITDVIMPDKDGYAVCEFIKRNERLAKTPVILMSGIVNRSVAEKAMNAKADELIRKPFQPQDLIGRVKKLLNPQSPSLIHGEDLDPLAGAENSNPLRNLFAAGASSSPSSAPIPRSGNAVAAATPPRTATAQPSRATALQPLAAPSSGKIHKLRNEVHRLELLVKKLQVELEAQRQYCAALEAHVTTLQETE